MQIDVKGRNLPVTDELRQLCTLRFKKIDKQVSEFAVLEVELFEEHNPAIANGQVAEATLFLKGVTLRATGATPKMASSVGMIAEELSRQVKRHRDKRRRRRETRTFAAEQALTQSEAGETPMM